MKHVTSTPFLLPPSVKTVSAAHLSTYFFPFSLPAQRNFQVTPTHMSTSFNNFVILLELVQAVPHIYMIHAESQKNALAKASFPLPCH